MPSIYRVTALGTTAAASFNATVRAELGGFAKDNAHAEFTIANEILAARLGQVVGLPVPAGVIAETKDGRQFYVSLDVGREGTSLPPIDPAAFVAQHPHVAAGAVCFDIWVANNDRHANNMWSDPAHSPPRPALIDHGHSLLGSPGAPPSLTGLARLAACEEGLGCTGKVPEQGNRQCLLDSISDAAALDAWAAKIQDVPDFVADDVCQELQELGILAPDLAGELARWVNARKKSITELISGHRDEFPAVTQWTA